MKASTQRSVVRWLHIGVGGIITTYIYSPWSEIASFDFAVKALIIPLTIVSGLWLWKGHLVKKLFESSRQSRPA